MVDRALHWRSALRRVRLPPGISDERYVPMLGQLPGHLNDRSLGTDGFFCRARSRAGRDLFAPLLAPLVFRALLRKAFAPRSNGWQ